MTFERFVVTFDVFARFLSRFWPYRGLYRAICGPNRVIVGDFGDFFGTFCGSLSFLPSLPSVVSLAAGRAVGPLFSRDARIALLRHHVVCGWSRCCVLLRWQNEKAKDAGKVTVMLKGRNCSSRSYVWGTWRPLKGGCGSCQLLLSGHIGWWATKANTIPIESRRTHCDERLTPKWEILFHGMWQFRGRSVKHEANDS